MFVYGGLKKKGGMDDAIREFDTELQNVVKKHTELSSAIRKMKARFEFAISAEQSALSVSSEELNQAVQRARHEEQNECSRNVSEILKALEPLEVDVKIVMSSIPEGIRLNMSRYGYYKKIYKSKMGSQHK